MTAPRSCSTCLHMDTQGPEGETLFCYCFLMDPSTEGHIARCSAYEVAPLLLWAAGKVAQLCEVAK